MSLNDRLKEFILDKLNKGNRELGSELGPDTPLISSGLLDSLALLDLFTWIDGEIEREMDLTDFEPLKEWDTQNGILNFIERNRVKEND